MGQILRFKPFHMAFAPNSKAAIQEHSNFQDAKVCYGREMDGLVLNLSGRCMVNLKSIWMTAIRRLR